MLFFLQKLQLYLNIAQDLYGENPIKVGGKTNSTVMNKILQLNFPIQIQKILFMNFKHGCLEVTVLYTEVT